MNGLLLGAVAVGALGLLLLVISLLRRARRGLGAGETVALDNVTLYSPRLRLVGRPDRVVKRGGHYLPEEWKSSRRVNRGHELQLGTYFLLIEEEYGVRPPFGVVVLGDGSRVRVRNTEALRAEVLSIAARIREQRARLSLPVRVNQPANKCRRCGQRGNCEQVRG
ncbi:MAG: Dna2/Cas4 domain-containing protein [Gemmataceae bacterium]